MGNSEIKKTILAALYEAWSVSDDDCNLYSMREQQGWDKIEFEKILDRMERENFIEPSTAVTHEITPRGIIYAETDDIVPEEMAQKNKSARTRIVEALLTIYNEQGPHAEAHYTTLARMQSLDENVVMKNAHVLSVSGYLEEPSADCYQLSYLGHEAAADYIKRNAIASEFEQVSEMSPQLRGRAFQKLLAKILERQGWTQLEGVRTSHEEMDVIVYRDRDFYLIECKWEKARIEASVIRELFGKLSNREKAQGIVVSMSGFAKGAIEQVQDYLNTRVILLFGLEDIKSLVYGKHQFEELLNEKYKELITQKRVLFA